MGMLASRSIAGYLLREVGHKGSDLTTNSWNDMRGTIRIKDGATRTIWKVQSVIDPSSSEKLKWL